MREGLQDWDIFCDTHAGVVVGTDQGPQSRRVVVPVVPWSTLVHIEDLLTVMEKWGSTATGPGLRPPDWAKNNGGPSLCNRTSSCIVGCRLLPPCNRTLCNAVFCLLATEHPHASWNVVFYLLHEEVAIYCPIPLLLWVLLYFGKLCEGVTWACKLNVRTYGMVRSCSHKHWDEWAGRKQLNCPLRLRKCMHTCT
eukprot:1139251-Pelagomonas_calceolata.AAC.2